MKLLYYFVVVAVLLAWLTEPARVQAQENYTVEKSITASKLAKELGIPFPLLQEANPDIYEDSLLEKNSQIKLPEVYYSFYTQKYYGKIGYNHFSNQDLSASTFYADAQYLFPIKKGSNYSYELGPEVLFRGGGLEMKDGSYKGPAVSWEANLKLRIRETGGARYEVGGGGGQVFETSQLATGYTQRLYSVYMDLFASFHPFSERFLKTSRWFNDASLSLKAKIAFRSDTLFWSGKPTNFDFLAEGLTAEGSLTVYDLALGKSVLLATGIDGAASVFDWQHKHAKFFYAGKIFVEPFWNRQSIGKLYAGWLQGISSVSLREFFVGAELNFGFFLNKNEPRYK